MLRATSPRKTSTPTRLSAAQRPYSAKGGAAKLWACRDSEVLLSGPAGTGKSRACLEKLHFCALKYAGMRGLIVRKTRESISESTLVTFEEKVVPERAPLLEGPRRNFRQAYYYPNGSQLVVGGMDKPSKIMSTEYDLIYVAEATELAEADWLALVTRLRNGRMPYQQIIADCNPDTPLHWLYVRSLRGAVTLIESRHEDNPELYREGAWTLKGQTYLAKLDALGTLNPVTGQREGAEYQRLRHGLWVQATGVILDQFSADNVTEAADYEPDAGPVLWGLDDGYAGTLDPQTGTYTADSHPRAILLAQLKPDGHLDIFAEDYRVKTLSDQHLDSVLALPYPAPDYVAHGPGSAEIRGRLFAAGLAPRSAVHQVEEGLKELQRALGPDANGYRRVRIHPRCTQLRTEIGSYRRDPEGRIIKAFDHGVDALRYLVYTVRLG